MVFRLNAAVSKLVRRISIRLSSSSSLSFYSPRFLTFLFLSSQESKSLFVSDGWTFSKDRDGCQLRSHCPATNSLESART